MAHPSSADWVTIDLELEEYSSLGGNCVHCHGEGGETHSRRATGQWLQRKGVRREFFVCTQICHAGWDDIAQQAVDRYTPEGVREDIASDLELLATDYLDLVYLDDNPQAPLEPVIDAIGDHIKNGLVRALGVRNWTAGRILAADLQLRAKGLQGVAAIVTTELALAASTEALWPEYLPFGVELARVVDALGLAVFAHAADMNLGLCLYGDADSSSTLRRHWIDRWNHPANAALVPRVQHYADAHRLTAREVNLAWILNRSFPCVAVIPLPSFLTSRRSEYERASHLTLGAGDSEFLSGHSSS